MGKFIITIRVGTNLENLPFLINTGWKILESYGIEGLYFKKSLTYQEMLRMISLVQELAGVIVISVTLANNENEVIE
jgi:hypothetical protein